MSSPPETENSELRWSRRPMAELVRLAWPIAVSMLSYSVMTLVDTAFVAGLGRSSLAAVGLGGVATFTFLCFGMGLLRGVKVLVSQAEGAGRAEEGRAYVAAGVVLALGLGVITVLVGELAKPLVVALASSPEAGQLAGEYLAIRILSAPLLFVFVALREARYGAGETRAPMVAGVSANILNVALDYVLIVVLDSGVAGAAWSSAAGAAWEALVLLWLARGNAWHGVRGIRRELKAVWQIGLPTGVQFLLEVGSFSLLSAFIASMAELQMAAHQIVIQALHFSFLPAYAVSEAGSVLAGQAVGANRDSLVMRVATRAMAVAAAYTAFCTVLFVAAGPWLLGVALDDAELIATAVPLLYVAGVFQVADAANMVARGVLRGTGDVRFTAIVGIATAWVTTPPLTWFLGVYLGLGALGGWIGLCCEIFVGAALFWMRLSRGRWRSIAAKSRADLARDTAPDGAVTDAAVAA